MAGIRVLVSVMPSVLALAGAAAIWFYPIDSTTIRSVERELKERHAV